MKIFQILKRKIIKDVNEMSPIEYLEYLQKRCSIQRFSIKNIFQSTKLLEEILKNRKMLFPKMDADKEKKEIADDLQRKLNIPPPTKYQNPLSYFIIKTLAQWVTVSAKEFSYNINEWPVIGTLNTQEVNACSILVPSGGYLVVLEDGLFTFMNLLAKVVASAMPLEGMERIKKIEGTEEIEGIEIIYSLRKEEIRKIIDFDKNILIRFQEVLFAYIINGNPNSSPQYLPSESIGILSDVIRDSAELFVIGHEYGHILKDHFNVGITKKMIGKENVDAISRNWEQEFEADKVGLQLMILSMQTKHKTDLTMSYCGADFFFSCIDIVEKSISILREGKVIDQISETHPPTELRREHIRQPTKENLYNDLWIKPIQFGESIEFILSNLFEKTIPELENMHQKRVKLSAVRN